MRYMAKVMREALSVKFPQASEKDILKVSVAGPSNLHNLTVFIMKSYLTGICF